MEKCSPDKYSPMRSSSRALLKSIDFFNIKKNEVHVAKKILESVKTREIELDKAYDICESMGEMWYDAAHKIEQVKIKRNEINKPNEKK